MATIKDIKNIALKPDQRRQEPEPQPLQVQRPQPAPQDLRNQQKEEPRPKKPSRLKKIHEFDFMITKENAPKILPFILYVSALVILYIANHHYGEKTLLKIDKMHKEMKELKADYYTSNAELSNKSMQSRVAKMVEPMGLKELTTPPSRIKLVNE